MLRNVGFAFLMALTPVAALSTGCIVECEEVDGVTVCKGENAVRFEASARNETVAYADGSAIDIQGANGRIRVVRGSGSDVSASVVPFILDKADNEENARSHMEKNLKLTATAEANRVVIRVTRESGSSGALGGDLTVTLPASFNGDFVLKQGNGSVDVDLSGAAPTSTRVINDGPGSLKVSGARGLLDIFASNGSIDLSVAEWAASGTGKVFSDLGDITLSVPSGAEGTMSLLASEELTESGIPSTWQSAGEGNAKSYTMGSGTGGHVDIEADFGSIALSGR